MADIENLKAQIQQQLISSGEYDRIATLLKERLAESGWYDNIKRIANNEISSQQDPNFEQLTAVLEPKALELVPESVREEILIQVKAFLEKTVEI